MRKVVVNTTPIIALSEIGELHLLKDLYGEIIIPNAVLEEIKTEPSYSEVRSSCDWIHTFTVEDISQKRIFQARLHEGEVEVILLALELEAELVILDDKLARKTAKYMELVITGTMGVLLKAKQKGIIDKVKPIMDRLIQNGLYVSPEVQESVLKIAQE